MSIKLCYTENSAKYRNALPKQIPHSLHTLRLIRTPTQAAASPSQETASFIEWLKVAFGAIGQLEGDLQRNVHQKFLFYLAEGLMVGEKKTTDSSA